MTSTITFPIAFAALAALLLWFIIGCRGKWVAKAFAIVATLSLSILLWNSLPDLEGWATHKPLPEDFEFVSYSVIEPSDGHPGVIYVWVVAHYEGSVSLAQPRNGEPRAHKVGYNRKLHEALEQATKARKGGRRVGGKKKKGGQQGDGFEAPETEFIFYVMPPPRLPEKDPPQ
jgi:hypothetical protein